MVYHERGVVIVRMTTSRMVLPTGIEPVFPASEASGLSVNLREQVEETLCGTSYCIGEHRKF